MKIRIKESELNHIEKMERLKRIVFKYWDINGPKINDIMKKLLGFEAERIGNWVYTGWLREYLGENNARDMVDKFLSQKNFKIDNCGGYEFDFKVINYKMSEYNDVQLDLVVDDVHGTVVLIMHDGMIYNLKKARNDEDFGWEIDNEILDCIYDFFDEKITSQIGYQFVIGKIIYASAGYSIDKS